MNLNDRSRSFIDGQLKLKADQLDHLSETNTGHREHEGFSSHITKLIHEEIEVLFHLREIVTDRMEKEEKRIRFRTTPKILTVWRDCGTVGPILKFDIDPGELLQDDYTGELSAICELYDRIEDNGKFGIVTDLDFESNPGGCIITVASENNTDWDIPVGGKKYEIRTGFKFKEVPDHLKARPMNTKECVDPFNFTPEQIAENSKAFSDAEKSFSVLVDRHLESNPELKQQCEKEFDEFIKSNPEKEAPDTDRDAKDNDHH